MSKSGQNVFKGLNAQALASMSLFLQYLREPTFMNIQLESQKFEDFNLHFNDGKKIICESKDWKKAFNFSHLKKVLESIIKKNSLGDEDEILIICSNLDKNLENMVHSAKYFKQIRKDFINKKRFSKQQAELISRIKFWQIPADLNEIMVQSLFAELIDCWLPQNDLIKIINDILIQRIYIGSADGKIYSRQDIIKEIDDLKLDIIKKSGVLDKEREKKEKILEKLGIALKDNKSFIWADNQLSSLSTQPDLMFFVVTQLENKKIDNLKKWGNLWQLYKVYRFSFSLFKIFEKNIHTGENCKYILEFFSNNISDIKRYYQHDFFDIDVIKITKKILEKNNYAKFKKEAFNIIKKLTIKRQKEIFYLKTGRDSSWEKGEVAKLLKKLYDKAETQLKNKIYKFIIETYNLVEDDGNFSHYTPRDIFWILRNWLNTDFEKKLPIITKVLSNQYNQFYKKFGNKLKFEGWEHMGGSTSFWGNNYSITDRHFISETLTPALDNYYKNSTNKTKAWHFIHSKCINKTENVSKNKPDFLNRAAIGVLLKRYIDENKKISSEAKNILKEFILSKKGIPHKSELIFQSLRDDRFSPEKKWQLVKISIDKYKTPVSPFIEQIVGELITHGHKEALEAQRKWLKTTDYFKKARIPVSNLLPNIKKLLQSDFEEGFKQFTQIIKSKYFKGRGKSKLDRFESYEWARLLNEIIIAGGHFNEGTKILKDLEKKDNLSINEQILLTSSLCALEDSNDKPAILDKIYTKFLNPFFNNLDNNNKKIYNKLPYNQAREAIVQYADRLVRQPKIKNRIKKTLRIIEVFKNDPDPYLPGCDPEDREAKYNEHKKIQEGEESSAIVSVRGWCAWVLAKCVVLDGRNHLKEILNITKQLLMDKNYYVKHMACFSLAQLARIRLSVLRKEQELFLNKDKRKALKMAKDIEDIAFAVLKDVKGFSKKVQKSLGKSIIRVFDHIRSLNETDALELINTIKNFPEEVITFSAPLFIYYAEFRKRGYKNWKWKLKGLYDDLDPEKYDNKKFQNILENLLETGSSEIKSKFAWEFSHLVGEEDLKKRKIPDYFDISYKYIKMLSKKYDHPTFENIYMFIKENMKQKFDPCYKLWIDCLKIEKSTINNLIKKSNLSEFFWWPFYYNGELLEITKEKGGNQKFLNAFKILSTYPKGINIGEIKGAVNILKEFPKSNKKVDIIFNNLLELNSQYYKDKKEWLNKSL